MAFLLVYLGLIIGASHLLKSKLGFSRQDTNIMWVGILGISALEALAQILVGLFIGMAGGLLLTHLISGLISGGFAYYIYTKSGL